MWPAGRGFELPKQPLGEMWACASGQVRRKWSWSCYKSLMPGGLNDVYLIPFTSKFYQMFKKSKALSVMLVHISGVLLVSFWLPPKGNLWSVIVQMTVLFLSSFMPLSFPSILHLLTYRCTSMQLWIGAQDWSFAMRINSWYNRTAYFWLKAETTGYVCFLLNSMEGYSHYITCVCKFQLLC